MKGTGTVRIVCCPLVSSALPLSLPMDVEPLYSAEQIRVPPELPDIMKQWAKEVIRANPKNIHEFSAK